jgi:hypothetical protein
MCNSEVLGGAGSARWAATNGSRIRPGHVCAAAAAPGTIDPDAGRGADGADHEPLGPAPEGIVPVAPVLAIAEARLSVRPRTGQSSTTNVPMAQRADGRVADPVPGAEPTRAVPAMGEHTVSILRAAGLPDEQSRPGAASSSGLSRRGRARRQDVARPRGLQAVGPTPAARAASGGERSIGRRHAGIDRSLHQHFLDFRDLETAVLDLRPGAGRTPPSGRATRNRQHQ